MDSLFTIKSRNVISVFLAISLVAVLEGAAGSPHFHGELMLMLIGLFKES
jgi:hypothetical protein